MTDEEYEPIQQRKDFEREQMDREYLDDRDIPDRLEDIKESLKAGRGKFVAPCVNWDDVDWLISEVEKLRSPSHYSKYIRVATPQDYVEQEKKIDSLTREVQATKKLMAEQFTQLQYRETQVHALTRDRDKLKAELDSIQANSWMEFYHDRMDELTIENVELKAKLAALEANYPITCDYCDEVIAYGPRNASQKNVCSFHKADRSD